jgi:hypothetical protein
LLDVTFTLFLACFGLVCVLVGVYERFRSMYCFHLQGRRVKPNKQGCRTSVFLLASFFFACLLGFLFDPENEAARFSEM